jgi:hypothetical protein
MELQVEDKLILSSIKIEPSPAELEHLNELILQVQDWNYLIRTIIDRGIGPLLYTKLPLLSNSSQIPESVKTNLQQAYYKTISRSTILYDHFRKIAAAFVEQNIPVIGLKGVYLSEWLYQDIGLRQFSDIDLLVKEEDSKKCLTILESIGYKSNSVGQLSEIVLSQFQKDIVHYPQMVKDGVSIELHIKLHSKNQSYNVLIQSIWGNAIPAAINGITLSALNNTDLLIHLCLHLDKHFKDGHVQFTCFNDITNLLEKYAETLNWNELFESCRLYNCEEVVFKYLVMVNTYMNAAVPADIIQKYSVLLTEKDKQLLLKYLKGFDKVNSNITLSAHVGYLKNVRSLVDKVRYLWNILFPSKAFMTARYQINNSWLVLFYYPYRYWIGVRGVVNHLFRR